MEQPIHLAIILGSVREGRMAGAVSAWIAAELDSRGDTSFSIVDPLHAPEPGQLRRELDRADAVLVVTPEYNHSFPGALKSLIDMAYKEWQTKPVGFVSYGGMAGGSRAVEQLRQVFSELHAPTVRDSVGFINVGKQFVNGKLLAPERPRAALERTLAQLKWWALASRFAREREDYPA